MTAIPVPLQTLLDLFATDLHDVRFGDLDAQALTAVASDVESASEDVASAQARLDDVRNTLQQRQDLLLQQAQRALAYARVYAEGNAALIARLDAIALPRPVRKTRPEGEAPAVSTDAMPPRRPRGRPRKIPLETQQTTLGADVVVLDATGE